MKQALVNKETGLTPKEARFAEEYEKSLNIGRAYQTMVASTGNVMKYQTAASEGSRMLKNPKVLLYLQELREKKRKNDLIDRNFVLENLVQVVERCMNASPVTKYNPKTRQHEQAHDHEGNSIWRFDSLGANKALETLAKMTGELSDININVESVQFKVFTANLIGIINEEIGENHPELMQNISRKLVLAAESTTTK